MKEHNESSAARLSQILQESRPAPELPVRFQEAVWRRIARADTGDPSPAVDWLAALVNWALRPRWALAGVAALLILGGFFGAFAGLKDARSAAQIRYLASVAPPTAR